MKIGSYTTVSQIGDGSFGYVYRATHTILGYPVAIKQSKYLDGPEVDLFLQEAQILSMLRHPAVPTLLDYIKTKQNLFMILSWAEGVTLESLIGSCDSIFGSYVEKPLADEHALWVVDRVLQALDYLHNKNIFHGDIKPSNIIVEVSNHTCVLTDFTVAVHKPTSTTKGKGGSPGFVAPEILAQMPPIAESDIYSVGKLALTLLGGNPLIGEIPRSVHPAIAELISEMISADPTCRPSDANLLRTRIENMRFSIWGRTSTLEAIKFRDKV